MADTLTVESYLQQIERPADSKEEYGPCHAMYYAKSCSSLKKKSEFFRAELNRAEWDTELWCWWRCVALSYSNRCFTKNTQGAWWNVLKVTVIL